MFKTSVLLEATPGNVLLEAKIMRFLISFLQGMIMSR